MVQEEAPLQHMKMDVDEPATKHMKPENGENGENSVERLI